MTVTANLHNCAAWTASHSYSLGARVSNDTAPVKAYQCITAGTSAGSGGPTGTGSSIADGTCVWKYLSAVDYSTLAAWAAALPATLTDAYVGQLWNDAEWVISSAMTLSGNTTTGTNTITLTAAPGESFVDNPNAQTNALNYNAANGVGIRCTVLYTYAILNSDKNFFPTRLQVKGQQYGIETTAFPFAASQCIIAAAQSTSNSIAFFQAASGGTSSQVVVRNCLFVINGLGRGILPTYSMSAFFCTIIDPSGLTNTGAAGIGKGYGAGIYENCLVYGFVTLLQSGGTTPTFTTCQTDIASPPAGFTTQSYASQFVNTASDWRLKTGAPAQGAGTADSTNGAFDIVGTARPQGSNWDIGCWELVSAVVTVALSGISSMMMRGRAAPAGQAALAARSLAISHGSGGVAGRAGLAALARNIGHSLGTVTGSAALAARGASASHGSGTPRGAVGLAARASLVSHGSTAIAGTASLAAIARAVSHGLAGIIGVMPLTARAQTASRGQAQPSGAVSLAGRSSTTAHARGGPSGALSLAALSSMASRAKGTLLGLASLTARGATTSRGKSLPRGAVSLSAMSRIVSTGRLANGPIAKLLTALSSLRSLGRARVSGVVPLSGRAVNVLTLTAAPTGRASLSGRVSNISTGAAQPSGTVALQALLRVVSWARALLHIPSLLVSDRRFLAALPPADWSGERMSWSQPATLPAFAAGASPDGDARVVTFDFAPQMAQGDTIASIVVIRVSVNQGNDPNPAAIILGSPTVGPSVKVPNRPNQAVLRMFGFAPGSAPQYLLHCAVLSSTGETLVDDKYMPVYIPH